MADEPEKEIIDAWLEIDKERKRQEKKRKTLGFVDYHQYMQSSDWAYTKDQKLRRGGHRCSVCSSMSDLHVHHITYERLGSENPEDLEVLCGTCHEETHRLVDEEGYPLIGAHRILLFRRIRANGKRLNKWQLAQEDKFESLREDPLSPSGKYKGHRMSQLDYGYLSWCVLNIESKLAEMCKRELVKRYRKYG